MTQQTQQPKYKELNAQRTQGNWEASIYDDELVLSTDKDALPIAAFYGSPENDITNGDALYTALAVNNLHHLAEALEELHCACIMNSDIPTAWWRKHKETVAKAKQALARIS